MQGGWDAGIALKQLDERFYLNSPPNWCNEIRRLWQIGYRLGLWLIHQTLNRYSSRFETVIANGIERYAVVDVGKQSSMLLA